MSSLTNQDNIGNYYFGFRTNNFAFSPSQIQLNQQTLVNWINTSFGGTYAALNIDSANALAIILPHPTEIITPPAIQNFRYRFSNASINTQNTNTTPIFSAITSPPLALNVSGFVYYCVLNNSSLNIFGCSYDGNNLNSSNSFLRSIGFVKNPIYSGSSFPRNLYYFSLSTSGSTGGRPDLENAGNAKLLRVPSSSTTPDPIANYNISCDTPTPGANATDLWLRENDAPNKAIGIAPNLLKTSLNIPVGQMYLNTGIDPDGSNNPHWICAGKMGTDSILMRAWAQGLI